MSKSIVGVGFAAFSLALISLGALAADQVNVTVNQPTSAAPMVHRVHDLTKMKVKNPQGQDLGKIEDLVVDVTSGKIRYAAMSFGGFLGIGDKLFAIPFAQLHMKQNAGDSTHFFEVNVTKEQLQNAQGFDKDNWPNFGDPNWSARNDKVYDHVTR